jgi:hypothetical protein
LLSVALTDISKAANELKDINNYKLYAHSRVGDFKQFICLEKAWTQESNWNPKAVGNKQGSKRVYGIPQIKNEKVRGLDPFRKLTGDFAT